MERDTAIRDLVCEPWGGVVRPGVFVTDDVKAVRSDWLREGVVPRASVRGFCEFNSITRATNEGDCIVKAPPQYFDETRDFAQRVGLRYAGQSVGLATLAAVEHLMAPKRESVTEAEEKLLLIKQNYRCAACSTF